MSMKRKAFTLAEVLITLAIIGVVAAMTIPALMNSTNQQEFKTAFKKSIAVLNQAITMNIALDNSDSNAYSAYTTSTTPAEQMMAYFSQRMNVISSTTGANASITTADGMQYFFKKGGTCLTTGSNPQITAASPASGCYILVDVNGAKKPNAVSKVGNIKDQFYIAIMDNSAIPAYDAISGGGGDVAQQIMYAN